MKKTITSLEEASLDACMCYVFAKLSHFYYYISNVSVVPYPQINSTEKNFFFRLCKSVRKASNSFAD